jgi:succinoglycan biosynthesis transport protein ExoP
MTLGQFVTILRARWISALAVLSLVMILTLVVSLLLPKQYTATASVFVDIKSPDPIAGVALAGMMAPGYMTSQVDVIQSERVALRAMRALRLNEDPVRRAKWQRATDGNGDFEAWLAETLQEKLDVKLSRDSNVITVAYTSSDPRFSAAMANAVVQGYIDTTIDLRVEPAKQYNSFFDERTKQLRGALEVAQTKLSDYQRSKGIVTTDERLDTENARLNELSTQLVALQDVATESLSRQAQANTSGDRMQEVLNNPVVAGLTADMARQQARLFEMSERLGDQHPQVRELQANIVQLRARIEAESRRVRGSVGVNNSVNQQRLAQLRASVEEQRAKVLRLKGQRDEASVLQRDVENAQRAYDAMQSKASLTNVESQSTLSNVGVLKRASEPAKPSFPKLGLALAAAGLLGLLFAVVTALLRELFDRRLRSSEDVLMELKLPILVTLPIANHRAIAEIAPRAQQIKHRVLAGLIRSEAKP